MGLTTGIRRLTTLCILVYLSFLGGCAFKAQPPFSKAGAATHMGLAEGSLLLPNGTSAPLLMSNDAFLERAGTADFILLGEGHTVPCDHLIQSRLINVLAESGTRFSIGLEMFPTDHQPMLDKALAENVPLAAFANATDWKNAWGYNFDLYRPVIEAAYTHKLPLHALNVPQAIVKKVSRRGISSLTAEERALLPAKIIPASDAQREALQEMFDAHKAMVNGTMSMGHKGDKAMQAGNATMPSRTGSSPMAMHNATMPPPLTGQPAGMQKDAKSVPAASTATTPMATASAAAQTNGTAPADSMTGRMDRFFLVQALWDTAMASEAIKVREQTGNPVVVILGSGHVEFGWGMAHRIRKLRPDSKILLVAPWRGIDPIDPLEADVRYYCRLTHQSKLGFTLLQTESGAEVQEVIADSRAAKAGFMKGDIVTAANGTPVDSMWVLHTVGMEAAKSGKDMAFTVLRGTVQMELIMPVSPPAVNAEEDAGAESAKQNNEAD